MNTHKLYLDTGALVKLYLLEPGSEFVQSKAHAAQCLPLNPLQETELRNALFAACGRGILTKTVLRKTLDNFEEDIRNGYLFRESPDWPLLWRRAGVLAKRYTPELLCRTLDILHVAAAEASEADEVLTGDQRQSELCRAIGLPVSEIDYSSPRS